MWSGDTGASSRWGSDSLSAPPSPEKRAEGHHAAGHWFPVEVGAAGIGALVPAGW